MSSPLWLEPRLAHLRGLLFGEFAVVALFFGVASWIALRATSDHARREWLLVAASLALVAWFSGAMVTGLWVAFAVVFRIVAGAPGARGAVGAVALLALMVTAPVRWIGELGAAGPHAREFTAFATNVALLRFWAWAWDRRRAAAQPESWRSYLARMLFFPTFVNGPIEPLRTFAAEWPTPTRADLAVGLRRVAGGAAKLALVALALEPGWIGGLAHAPAAPVWRLWAWGALLYAWFYLSFSAWSDLAIGVGRLCGRRVQENFDRPWRAAGPAEFWRRWHVSLGLWLRDYVYVPLGGNRRHRGLNVLVTFVASALWHVWGTLKLLGLGYYPAAAWGGFLVWGLVHAGAVTAVGRLERRESAGAVLLPRRIATFAFAAWAWIPFFLPASVPLAAGIRLMARMVVPLW